MLEWDLSQMVKGLTFLSLTAIPGGRAVSESSEGSTASKWDRTGQNPGTTRLVRRSSAMS